MRPFPNGNMRIMDSSKTIEAYTVDAAWFVWAMGFGSGLVVMAIASLIDHYRAAS